MEIITFELIPPTEENQYCVFESSFEDDQNIFFHMTLAENMESIITNGFYSAYELKSGDLTSVSYAKRSSGCFANLASRVKSEYVIFAVKFHPDVLMEVVVNSSDIQVHKPYLQPEILGIVRIPLGFML